MDWGSAGTASRELGKTVLLLDTCRDSLACPGRCLGVAPGRSANTGTAIKMWSVKVDFILASPRWP